MPVRSVLLAALLAVLVAGGSASVAAAHATGLPQGAVLHTSDAGIAPPGPSTTLDEQTSGEDGDEDKDKDKDDKDKNEGANGNGNAYGHCKGKKKPRCEVPEVPWTLALPVGAAGIAAGYYVIQRRRGAEGE